MLNKLRTHCWHCGKVRKEPGKTKIKELPPSALERLDKEFQKKPDVVTDFVSVWGDNTIDQCMEWANIRAHQEPEQKRYINILDILYWQKRHEDDL